MRSTLVQFSSLRLHGAVWGLAGAMLALLVHELFGVEWPEAFVFGVPAALIAGPVSLSAGYLCRALPLARTGTLRIAATTFGAALVTAAVWAGAGRGWWQVLRSSGFSMPAERADAAFTLLLGLGVLGYLLAVTAHYVTQVSEESAVAARRALESQVAQREAELQALRAQIDPHFLFNSLNSVIGLIDADQVRAKAMCLGLAEFLRDSLVLGREPRIPLGREVGLARQYLGVEQVRFGRRLAVRSEVDDSAAACPVPPLILQPLVENAVRHGIATLLDGGEIAIEARVTGPRLFVEVTNPFDPDAPRRGTGFGLDIVRRRLAAIYGDAASLATGSENARFRVAVTVPSGPEREDTA